MTARGWRRWGVRAVGGLALVLGVSCATYFDLASAPNGDGDLDGRPDETDNCTTAYNPDQSDKDHDSIGDACDDCLVGDPTDSDGDGVPDGCDACDNRQPDTDGDQVPDICEVECTLATGVDQDLDGIDDGCDKCIVGVHPDSDGDGVPDGCDLCPGFPDHDEDGDGTMDGCDNCPGHANDSQADSPGPTSGVVNGIGDVCDPAGDSDGTHVFDAFTTQRAAWNVQGTGWEIDPAKDEYDLTTSNLSIRLLPPVTGNFTLSTIVRFPAPSLANPLAEAGLIIRNAPETEFIRCSITPGGNLQFYYLGNPAADIAAGLAVTQPVEVVVTATKNSIICTAKDLESSFPRATAMIGETTVPRYVGIGGKNVNARFAWFDQIYW